MVEAPNTAFLERPSESVKFEPFSSRIAPSVQSKTFAEREFGIFDLSLWDQPAIDF
jgi:hypothetical protein